MSRPRVLLIAEAANPEWVSVPLVGWSHARALADVADIHLITHARNRDAILRAGWQERSDFTALDSDAIARPLWIASRYLRGGAGKGWTVATALSGIAYYYFERLLWREFGQRIRGGEFQLVHRLTPLSPTVASLLAAKCQRANVPFVLGPLNGGLPWPTGFHQARWKEREWLSYARSAYKCMPGYHATRRCASALIVGSGATWQQMPRQYHEKCIYIAENAIDPQRFSQAAHHSPKTPLRVVFLGRLVPYKGIDMLLEAIAPLARANQITLEIIGDGPLMNQLRKYVEQQQLETAVSFAGWIDHQRVQEKLAGASVFAFPSVREFGGGVVLEAMALGLVPIVVDYGGPGELVTETTGYKVPIGSRDQIVNCFRTRLAELSSRPEQLANLGQHARQRVMQTFTWPAKAQQMLEVYRWVLGERSEKPDFGFPMHSTA